jgi:hypothetical protein
MAKIARLCGPLFLAMLSFAGCAGLAEDQSGGTEDEAATADADGELRWQPGYGRGRPCRATQECPNPGFFACSTARGVCNPPPGCNPRRQICPQICYGTCEPRRPVPPGIGRRCGNVMCPQGTTCCNPLMSMCVAPGRVCPL